MPVPLEDHPSAHARVLIVEDDADSADMLRTLLELRGHTVRIANDGASGLAVASQFDPHFVLLDLSLPVVHGGEVAQHLRANAQDPHPVIVGTTGFPAQYTTGATSFDHRLSKPIDFAALTALIDTEWDQRFRQAAHSH
jgi:DNA-binding response OmpR family regulator